MKKSAVIIGSFAKGDNDVFTGKLETLAHKGVTITLQPNDDKEKDNHPDYIVLHGMNEIGVAWKRGNTWGEHISLAFEEPSLVPGLYRLQKSGAEKGYTLLYRQPFAKKDGVKLAA
jgi:uncharacterized protein (DUF736 family)